MGFEHKFGECPECQRSKKKNIKNLAIYKSFNGARLQITISPKCYKKNKKRLAEEGYMIDWAEFNGFER